MLDWAVSREVTLRISRDFPVGSPRPAGSIPADSV